MAGLGKILTRLEICWNVPGYVPKLSNVTGGIRGVCGGTQAVSGVALFAIGAVGSAFASGGSAKSFETVANWGIAFVLNGCANMGRGFMAEQVPVLGNGACIAYDICCFIMDARVFSYPGA